MAGKCMALVRRPDWRQTADPHKKRAGDNEDNEDEDDDEDEDEDDEDEDDEDDEDGEDEEDDEEETQIVDEELTTRGPRRGTNRRQERQRQQSASFQSRPRADLPPWTPPTTPRRRPAGS